MENLISLVKNLQRARTALADHGEESALPTDWDVLPSVAVVGSQSSGKSSVLESLVGKDFLPKGPGIVTRCPLVLQLHRIDDTEEYTVFLRQPAKRYTNFSEVRKEITNEIDRVTGRSKGISPDPIHLSIFSPTVVNLTLIDLPGLTKIAVYGQSYNIVQEIESMVRAFIEKPDCIILAVSPANQDLATSDAIKIAREVDPKGERTFGVLTKIDLMDKGTDAVDILEGRFYQLQFPWIGVVNRSQQDLSKSIDMTAARLRERDYFANTPEYKHLAHRMGSENLARSLSKHLESFIRSKIPVSYLCNDSSLKCQVTKKNRLQGYMLRAYGTFPTYMLNTQQEQDNMTFECTVQVKDQAFVSAKRHVHRKDAEEDAANVAYNAVMGDETMDALIQMTNKSSFSSINILNEYVQKKRLSDPASADAVYKSSKVAVQSQQTLWVSTLTVGGQVYLGDIAKSKRLSVQQVAATAVKSMLEAGNAILINMVLSKRVRVEVSRKKSRKRGAGVRTGVIEGKKREIVASTHDEDVDSEK